MGGGQRVEKIGVVPVAQLTGPGRVLYGMWPIEKLLVRTSSADPGQGIVGGSILGTLVNRVAEIGNCLLVVAHSLIDTSAVEIAGRILGIETNGLAVVRDRFVELIQDEVGGTAVVVSFGTFRIE